MPVSPNPIDQHQQTYATEIPRASIIHTLTQLFLSVFTRPENGSSYQQSSGETLSAAQEDATRSQGTQATDKDEDEGRLQSASAGASNKADQDKKLAYEPASHVAVEVKNPASTEGTLDQAPTLVEPTTVEDWAQKFKDLYIIAADQLRDVIQHRSRLIERDRYARYVSDDIDELATEVITALQNLATSSKTFKAALPFQTKASKFLKSLERFRKGIRKAERAHKRLLDAEQDLQEYAEDVYNDILRRNPIHFADSDERVSSLLESASVPLDEIDIAPEDPDTLANLFGPPQFMPSNASSHKYDSPTIPTGNERTTRELEASTNYRTASAVEVEIPKIDPVPLFNSANPPYDHGDDINACGTQFDTGTVPAIHDREIRLVSDLVLSASRKRLLMTTVGFVTFVYIGQPSQPRLFDLARRMDGLSPIPPSASNQASQLIKDIHYQDADLIFPTILDVAFKSQKKVKREAGQWHVQNWLDDPNLKDSVFNKAGVLTSPMNEDTTSGSPIYLEETYERDTITGSITNTTTTSSDTSVSLSASTLRRPHTVDQMIQQPRPGDIATDARGIPPRLRRHHSWPAYISRPNDVHAF